MGNLFSRNKEPILINEDDQFFDCLNDDETHEHDKQNHENTTQTISHYYAVWIPSTVETPGKENNLFSEIFSMKNFLFRK